MQLMHCVCNEIEECNECHVYPMKWKNAMNDMCMQQTYSNVTLKSNSSNIIPFYTIQITFVTKLYHAYIPKRKPIYTITYIPKKCPPISLLTFPQKNLKANLYLHFSLNHQLSEDLGAYWICVWLHCSWL